jgi:hypothetical protein
MLSHKLIHGIKKKLWPLVDDVQFVPGHGAMSNSAQNAKQIVMLEMAPK